MRFFFVISVLLLLAITPATDCFATTWDNLYVTCVVDQTNSGGKYFFAEKADRSWATKVILTSDILPSVGSTVNVSGDLDSLGALRKISNATYMATAAIIPPKSLGMGNKSLLLGLRGKAAPTHALLVTIWGKVCRCANNDDPNSVVEWDQVNQSYCFYVEDGTGRYGPSFTQSLKIFCDSYNSVYEGQFVSVEGVIDSDMNFTVSYPVIWPTKSIQIH